MPQDTRLLQVLILNLVPLKEDTKFRLLHALSDIPLQVDYTFLMTSSHGATHTGKSHIPNFYTLSNEAEHHHFDGFIITGTPVEDLPYEEVSYQEGLCEIMGWLETHVTSTSHICWGAQVGLYYHYGIQEYPRKEKLSSVYCHKMLYHSVPLVRSMDDYMDYPCSRWTEVRHEDTIKHPRLTVLAESDETGMLLLMDKTGRRVFVQGHPEYDRMTSDSEYRRGRARGMEPKTLLHYYENDDPSGRPLLP